MEWLGWREAGDVARGCGEVVESIEGVPIHREAEVIGRSGDNPRGSESIEGAPIHGGIL